jgi:hypothetical protein
LYQGTFIIFAGDRSFVDSPDGKSVFSAFMDLLQLLLAGFAVILIELESKHNMLSYFGIFRRMIKAFQQLGRDMNHTANAGRKFNKHAIGVMFFTRPLCLLPTGIWFQSCSWIFAELFVRGSSYARFCRALRCAPVFISEFKEFLALIGVLAGFHSCTRPSTPGIISRKAP